MSLPGSALYVPRTSGVRRLPERRRRTWRRLPKMLYALPPRGRVKHRRWRLLAPRWTSLRILAQHAVDSERLTAGSCQLGCRLALDRFHQLGDSLPIGLRRQVCPTWQGRQLERLFGGVLEPTEVLAAVPGGILLRPVYQKKVSDNSWGTERREVR